ncbi:MAG: hypothetical protein WBZ15_08695, partial [Mycobacterium sp.]|uniref:hypothetical protein n=1 Tax=Mycobacterium sp. TaxID=1785 RepID=UPI003C6AABE0
PARHRHRIGVGDQLVEGALHRRCRRQNAASSGSINTVGMRAMAPSLRCSMSGIAFAQGYFGGFCASGRHWWRRGTSGTARIWHSQTLEK